MIPPLVCVHEQRGFSIIPIKPMAKTPLISWERYQQERPSLDQLTTWAAQFPGCNWAVVTGKISGVTVIDVDSPDAAAPFVRMLPPTVSATTAHGRHLFFKYEPRLVTGTKRFPGCDVRNDGGYVLVEPSIHPEGTPYRMSSELVAVASLPPNL